MPRKKHLESDLYPFHIGARCINKDWFGAPVDEVWEIMENYLFFLHHGFNVKVYSFVLMSNHFHMLARFPELNMSQAMGYFMKETSRSIRKPLGRINQTYGGRYHRCEIKTTHYFNHAYKYVYRNPVEAGLCRLVEGYKYSTLRGILGGEKLNIPLEHDDTLFSDLRGTVNWLNISPTEENKIAVQRALSRSVFKLYNNPKTRKPYSLEIDAY